MRRTPGLAAIAAVLACAALLRAGPARAEGPALSEADRAAIRGVIQRQIDAFRRDDAPAAFALASPSIRERFHDAEQFLAMVRTSYQAVYRPRKVVFLEAVPSDGAAIQKVLVVGPDGVQLMAIYPMARLEDGTWATDGCLLVALPGSSA